MDHTPHGTGLIVMAAIILFSLYRRARSHIGRQPVRPNRMIIRMVFLGLIAVAMQLIPHLAPYARVEEVGGIAVGAGLAWWGLRMTRFSVDGTQRYYTPNMYLGLAISTLFIARIAYRFIVLAPVLTADHADAGFQPQQMFGAQSGLTLAMFGVVAGYYVAYTFGVLRLSDRQPVVETAAVPSSP
jgi:hypothetical protein